ncbi:eukaryotic porin domain-containing protein, putative [Eimeria acervulina]|uniref:Eukaryotic porin domain-containing protein, putative n=1 Tax=Eimeria acervulina TaxID=5801 RepID=U6H107_EIMAC|nr:eukaryotic porin domain-containing protein, putative [Eimeria acervulina]CDI84444.1 eukaryotic porin domain-containing protein, putative [Eimeria acervulina]
MPFFAFLRCGGHSSAGRRQCRGESAFDARLPCTSAVPFRSDDCPSVARCAEKGSGFLGVPGLSFFGSKESQAPAGDDSNAADMRKKVLQDAVARENEEAPEPAKKPQLTQPIPFEQFSREWMNISGQDTFDGFRLEAPPDPSQGENAQPSPPHFFAMAKLGTDGSLQGRLIKTLCQSADLKLNFNSSLKDDQRNFYEISLDNTGRDWASSLKLAWQSCWILDGMFSQVLTPKLQAGCEITYVGANGASMLAVGGRYNLDKQSVVSCQLSQQPDFKSPTGLTKLTHSCKVQYARKVTDRLSMATEYEYSHPETESALRLGWEYLFRQARVQGLIDTGGRISVFAQDYNGFGVSGLIDYWRGTYKFGFLMHVVPPPDGPPPQSS